MSGMAIYTLLRSLGIPKWECIVLLDMYDVNIKWKSNGYIGAYHSIIKYRVSELFPEVYIK